MTVATIVNADLIGEVAEACVGALPAENGWSMAPFAEGQAPEPGAGAMAVAAPLGDGIRLVLAVNAGLGRSVQVGPPPAEDLLDGLRPALSAAAAALSRGLGGGMALDEPVETPAAGALRPGPGEMVTAAVLLDGDAHVATLAVISPRPAEAPAAEAPPAPAGHEFPPLAPVNGLSGASRGGPIELLSEVEMGVTVELGRARMLLREILELSPGSVIELDRAAGNPIDVLVNGTLIARGEVVVIDEEFGIRITEVIGYEEGKQPR